jgi:glutathione S-transferase
MNTAMLTLFEHPLSPYAQKCKIAMYEKGVTFEAKMPEAIGTGDTAGFLKINPRGEVPALLDGGFAIFDSTVILEYIEDKWPAPPLLPATPAARARARMIEDVMDTTYEPINWGLGEIRWFKRAEGELAETITARAKEQVTGLHAWLTRELGDGEWLNVRVSAPIPPHRWGNGRRAATRGTASRPATRPSRKSSRKWPSSPKPSRRASSSASTAITASNG